MTYTRNALAWLVGLALAAGNYAGGLAAEPGLASDAARPATSTRSASAGQPTAAPAAANKPLYTTSPAPKPSAAPPIAAANQSGQIPNARALSSLYTAQPSAPANPRLAELTKTYADLEGQILALIEKSRKSQDAAEKSGLRQQIQELVARQFDLRQEARELEMERLRKQLAEVEQTIGRQKTLKEKVVDRRVTDILDANGDLKWEPLAGASVPMRTVYAPVPKVHADGARVVVPRNVRTISQGQMLPPASAFAPATAGTAVKPTRPATGVAQNVPMTVDSRAMRGGVGTTGPDDREQLAPDQSELSLRNVTAGQLALSQALQRLAVAQQGLERAEALHKRSFISDDELSSKRAEAQQQELAVERAKREFEGQSELLKLDLQAAEVDLNAAQQRLGTAPDRLQAERELRRAEIELQRAKVLLQLHTTGSAQDAATAPQPAKVGASATRSMSREPAPSVDRAATPSGVRQQSMNNLKQIALAMHVYHDTHKSFPPAYVADKNGRPLLSWRVLILPFLEQVALYRQFRLDEPWDSEHNRKLSETAVPTYRSPGSIAAPWMTNYLTVRGPNTAFPGKDTVRIADIIDGTSNTIMVVEVSDLKSVVWTKPDDFAYNDSDPMGGLVGLRPEGFLGALCDGSVHLIPSSVEQDTLRRVFVRDDGMPIPWPLGKPD